MFANSLFLHVAINFQNQKFSPQNLLFFFPRVFQESNERIPSRKEQAIRIYFLQSMFFFALAPECRGTVPKATMVRIPY